MNLICLRYKKFILIFYCVSILLNACHQKQKGEIEASGIIEAIEVEISNKVAGQIKKMYYEEGQFVKKNDLLAEIDCEDYELQMMQAQSNLQALQAQYTLILKGARSEDINEILANKTQAEANYNNAKINYERLKRLLERNIISKKVVEDAETKLQIAEAQLKQANEAVKKIKKISREEEIAMAKAKLENFKWALESARKKVKDCKIFSPINGIVLKKIYEEGEYAIPSSILYVLSDLKKVRIIIYLREEEIFKIKYGQEASIKIDGYKDRVFKGRVSFISQEAEFTPKNIQTKDERVKLVFAVKILVDNPEIILKPGLPADVKFNSLLD